ncbi:DUF4422 domain-containing protein [Segatella bryantii]|uniref:DUF4422 domain-containing protein n=1 Tax=Segatella bryantii TaxID=77095 RepID=UPI00242C2225|nr:DUF4422 domain-containing protein [Segatella bryantii]
MKDIKILVAHHKESFVVKNPLLLPIQVNREKSPVKLNMQGDDTGDNISSKNSIYCEMTAIYWAWKNVDADYYGLFHYRRFFTCKDYSLVQKIRRFKNRTYGRLIDFILRPGGNRVLFPVISTTDEMEFVQSANNYMAYLQNVLDEEDVDAIFGEPYYFTNMNNRNYFEPIGRKYINLLVEICQKMDNNLYYYLTKVLEDNELNAANMFIMKKELFFAYCESVFSILDSVVERLQKDNWVNDIYSEKATARFVGYLAELLTCAYCKKLKSEKKNIKLSRTIFLDN